jgi:hypothetical protein
MLELTIFQEETQGFETYKAPILNPKATPIFSGSFIRVKESIIFQARPANARSQTPEYTTDVSVSLEV